MMFVIDGKGRGIAYMGVALGVFYMIDGEGSCSNGFCSLLFQVWPHNY